VMPRKKSEAAIQMVAQIEELRSIAPLLRALSGNKAKTKKPNQRAKSRSKTWSRTRKT